MSRIIDSLLLDEGNDNGNDVMNINNKVVASSSFSPYPSPTTTTSKRTGIEAIFIKGIAGSGKTKFVESIIDQHLSVSNNDNNNANIKHHHEWITIKAKFQRGKEHTSMKIISNLFDDLIQIIVACYPETVEMIKMSVGCANLRMLVHFLPSLQQLVLDDDGENMDEDDDDISCDDLKMRSTNSQQQQSTLSLVGGGDNSNNDIQLVYSLSKIIEAIVGVRAGDKEHQNQQRRYLCICCDDLQFADKASLSLLSEIIVSIGILSTTPNNNNTSRHCLFIGMYRDDEINDTPNHPFAIQYSYLQMMTNVVHITSIHLSIGLTKDDVFDMLMSELTCNIDIYNNWKMLCIKRLVVDMHYL